MKIVNKVTLSLATAGLLFVGCSTDNSSTTKPKEVVKVSPTISEESLGLRKTNLYAEDDTAAAKTEYGKSQASSGYKIKRAFQDAPPMIPHDTEGMLPIKIGNNACTGCHMPEVATSMGATPIPVSHFTNFRPHHNFDGKMFKKSIDNMKNEVSIQQTNRLQGARFNCSQCHAPQSQGNLAVQNTFEAVFSDKDGASKSSWSGTRLTDSLDTNGANSNVSEKDLKMESAAGTLGTKVH